MINRRIDIFVFSFYFVVLHYGNCFPQGESLRMRINVKQSEANTLTLPSNATSIRDDIVDTFSCENKTYGYYADIDNDCQIFHVCLPVTYSDGRNQTFRWSFICPEYTIFSQENFVCVREEDMTTKCEDSADLYVLNDNFGDKEQEEDTMVEGNEISHQGDQGEMEKNSESSMTSNMNSGNNEMAYEKKRRKPVKGKNQEKEELLTL